MSARGWIVASLIALLALSLTIALAFHRRAESGHAASSPQASPAATANRLTPWRPATLRARQLRDALTESLEAERVADRARDAAMATPEQAVLVGIVRDLGGAPLRGVSVEVEGDGLSTRTDESGRFEFAGLAATPVALHLAETQPPYRTARVARAQPGGRRVEVTLGWTPAEVSGTVVDDATGDPIQAFALVINHYDLTTGRHTGTGIEHVADPRGEFALTLDSIGRHRLSVRLHGARPAERELVVTHGGQQFRDLRLRVADADPREAQGVIAGELPSAEAVIATAGEALRTQAGVAGEFILDGVAPGSHTLVVLSPEENGRRRVEGFIPDVTVEPGAILDLGAIAPHQITPVAQGG